MRRNRRHRRGQLATTQAIHRCLTRSVADYVLIVFTAGGDSVYGTISVQLSFAAASPTVLTAASPAPLARQRAVSAAAADSPSPRVARKAELKQELQAMKPTALRKRAIAESVDQGLLDDALDSDNPKEAVRKQELSRVFDCEPV